MLAAKYYIRNKEQLHDYQCSTCFQVNYELLMCEGFCKKKYCKNCFKQFGYRRHCKLCVDAQRGVYLPSKSVEFACPSEACRAVLKSPQQFDRHCVQCQLLPQQTREQFYFKLNYMCNKGHRLSYHLMMGTCSICLESYYGNKCSVCSLKFCTNCRPPPCSKRQCSIGHELKPNMDRGTITCDLCAIPIKRLTEKRIYSDRECDFDTCLACHLKLPEEHPLPEFKQQMKPDQIDVESDGEEFVFDD